MEKQPIYLEHNVAELMRDKLRVMGVEAPKPNPFRRLAALAMGVIK